VYLATYSGCSFFSQVKFDIPIKWLDSISLIVNVFKMVNMYINARKNVLAYSVSYGIYSVQLVLHFASSDLYVK
jgi:hypothetical protein